MSKLLNNTGYKKWLVELKSAIKQSQAKAALVVNSQLILLYWDLGRQIIEKQEKAKWGTGFINQLSKDLKAEFPEMGGFSAYNLSYCKIFYSFYSNLSISEQVVQKLKDDSKAAKNGNKLSPKLIKQIRQNGNSLFPKFPGVIIFLF